MRHLTPRLLQLFVTVALLASVVTTFSVGQLATALTSGAQGITLSPASTQLTVPAGTAIQGSFEVVNSGEESYTVNLSVAPYRIEGVDYTPQFTQLPGTVETASWVSIAGSSAQLNPHALARFNYTVSVPDNAAPGGYYAILFAETSPDETDENSGIIPHNRVGSILYITVPGEVTTSGNLTAEPSSLFVIQPNIPTGVKVSNTGGVHFVSEVTFTIRGITDKQLYQETFERYILPQTERRISTNWTPPYPIGIYSIERSAVIAGAVQTLPKQWVIYAQPWLVGLTLVIVAVTGLILSARVFIRKHKPRNGLK